MSLDESGCYLTKHADNAKVGASWNHLVLNIYLHHNVRRVTIRITKASFSRLRENNWSCKVGGGTPASTPFYHRKCYITHSGCVLE